MHRCSESIGAIAAALAKAQTELTNPEKSLIATLPSLAAEGDRTFRYAPLSSGLEIVRKCLGRHEIAAIQTTAIDVETGIIRLTTVLAHSSGEWVSSDWPVCPASETATPHRMGTALTYARRYALFTLVGIAGDDDLDVPRLDAHTAKRDLGSGRPSASEKAQVNRPINAFDRSKSAPPASPSVLDAEGSNQLQQTLIAEIEQLGSGQDATLWAQRSLPIKNTLTAADATAVERAFADRLAGFSEVPNDPLPVPNDESRQNATDGPQAAPAPSQSSRLESEGDARPVLPKSIRLRDKEHCKFVANQPCIVCGRVPSDPHHLRFAQPRALGRKVSDEFTVPLCRTHHRELHRRGDEAAWWQAMKTDPMPLALELWQRTRLDRSIEPADSPENSPKMGNIKCVIPRSRHDPKILWVDDAEIVGDRITKVRPIPRNLFTQKTERRIGELGTSCVALVVSDVSVHEAP